MKRKIIATILSSALLISTLGGCTASTQRELKSLQSEWTGGLNRTVTVYSYNGEILGQWTGKFDVSSSAEETFFDIDGKRVIIQGGIVINEEQK